MDFKDWVLFLGVSSLIIERIIRWFFRFHRPEKEIDKIALEMVKLKMGRDWDSTPLTFFYSYKEALKKNLRLNKDFVDYLINREEFFNQKVEQVQFSLDHKIAMALELESILKELKAENNLPQKLEEFLDDISRSVRKESNYIAENKEKLQAIIKNIFKKQ
jgi:hypothetical protein